MADFISKLSWFVILIAVGFLVLLIVKKQAFLATIYFLLLIINFFLLIQLEKNKNKLKEIGIKIEELNFKAAKSDFGNIRINETKNLVNEFGTEMKLEDYKIDQEKKYRDISKKILDLETKLNEKFDLLGKAILKIDKEKKSKSDT